MNEAEFAETVAGWLTLYVTGCEVATKKSVLYALSFDEQGRLQLGVDEAGKPVRGGGTGFEQDILIYEQVQGGDTSIIPRVIAEVKLGRVSIHSVLTYAEKARRIRIIYPYVRYGLILGQMPSIPGRVLRLGQEFDFITVVSYPTPADEIEAIRRVFSDELQSSRDLGMLLSGQRKIKALFRGLRPIFEVGGG